MAFKMKGFPQHQGVNMKSGAPMKKSPMEKSYKEAYKDADKSKYKTEADFVKAAKAYNLKTTGTTEVTKDAKALKTDRAGLVASKKKRDEVSVKKEVKKADLKPTELKTIKKVNLRPEKKKETTVANANTSNVKERTKAGKLGVKVGNIFRKKGNKKTPGYKTVKNTDHNEVHTTRHKLDGDTYKNKKGKLVRKTKTDDKGGNVYDKTINRDNKGRKTTTMTSKKMKDGTTKTTQRNKKGTLLGRILKGTNKKVVTRK